MRISLTADHNGFELKELLEYITSLGHEAIDLGLTNMIPLMITLISKNISTNVSQRNR